MVGENLSHKFRLKNIEETRNCFIKKKDQNKLMSKKHKKVCTTLNYVKHFLILRPLLDVFQFVLLLFYLVFP